MTLSTAKSQLHLPAMLPLYTVLYCPPTNKLLLLCIACYYVSRVYSVSPYKSRLRLAHSNRCDHDPCYAASLYHALLPCNQLYSSWYLNYSISRAMMYRVFIRYAQTQTRHGVFLHTHGSDSRDDFRRHAKSWRSSTRPQIDDHRTHRRQGILALP